MAPLWRYRLIFFAHRRYIIFVYLILNIRYVYYPMILNLPSDIILSHIVPQVNPHAVATVSKGLNSLVSGTPWHTHYHANTIAESMIRTNNTLYVPGDVITLFYEACDAGNLEMVKHAVNIGDIHDYIYETGVYKAIRNGYIDIVKYCVDPDNSRQINYFLITACRAPYLDIVKYLISLGADVHSNEYNLTDAINYGNFDIVEYLISQGCKMNFTPTWAIFHGMDHLCYPNYMRPKSIDYYISLGADINSRLNYYLSCGARNGRLDIVEYMVAKGADIHHNDNQALHMAVDSKNLDVIKYLLDRGVDINRGRDPVLSIATEHGQLSIVKYLVEHGAEIHGNNEEPLCNAVNTGSLSIAKYLVSLGADPRADGDKPFIWACKGGRLKEAKYLISLGADPRVDDDAAIVEACCHINLNLVKYLVQLGADYRARGDMPLRNAVMCDRPDITKYLVSLGADLRAVCRDDIMKTYERRGFELLKYLAAQGVPVPANWHLY